MNKLHRLTGLGLHDPSDTARQTHGPTLATVAAQSTIQGGRRSPLDLSGEQKQGRHGTTCDRRRGFGPSFNYVK